MAEEEQQDFSKLSLDDRCQHKNWKARVSAYDELAKIFLRIDDEKSGEWIKYAAWVRKFPADSNAAAQEKGLEVALSFLENAGQGQAGRIVGELMSGVVTKCITAPKAKSKELAMNITLMCVEVEKFEVVQEELMKGMEHKNPKVVGGCINIMTEVLKAFGPKVINLKSILKKIPVLIEDRDKTVRDETKKLMVELYRWLGAAFKPQLSAVKPLVVQEVEQEVEKYGSDKPKQTRYLRSQQARQERAAAEEVGEDEADGEEAEEATPDIDPYDLLDPVDILAKLPKDFYEKCEAKKWQERKEAMEALETLAANPKLEPGDYADLVRMLKRIVGKDNNVVVVALAGKCIAGLANGLKKKFSPYAPSCISTILEKFKEKKPNVVTAMKEAIDACFTSTSLESIQEDTITALQNKNPAVKLETNAFLARAFSKTSFKVMSDKKLMKPFFTAIVANLNEPDPTVRDAAAEAFGVALKHLGEKTLTPFIADLEPIKLQKVKECSEKAVLTAPKEKGSKPAPKAVSAPKQAAVRPGPKAGGSAAVKKPAASVKKATNASKIQTTGKVASAYSDEDISMDAAMTEEPTDDDGITRVDISPQITEALLNELSDKTWKTRDEALTKIGSIIASNKHLKADLGDLPQALASRLQDSNKNLATNTFLLCQNLAGALGPNCKPHISTMAASMLSGLSDSKTTVRSTVVACINAWADNGGVQEFFLGGFIPDALKSGNPYLRTELFNWLSIRLPAMRTVNKDELNACIPHLLTGVEDRNPEVRKSAQDAVLPFMIHLGFDAMTRHASRLKPTSKTAVQALLDKARPNLPAKPSSGATIKKSTTGKAIQGGGGTRSAASVTKTQDSAAVIETKSVPASKIGRVAPSTKGSPPSKKTTEEQIGANLQSNNLKPNRISDEMKLKILKWNFTTPRDEFIDMLKELMTTAGFSKTLMANMFHTDFKMHLKALDTLQEEFSQGFEGTMCNLDLILKWSTLRFFDTNPSVLIRILEYLGQVFRVLGDQAYNMADVEGNAFIPYLLLKIGDPKDTIRSSVHHILRMLVNVYSPQRVFSYVMEGLKSKNARQRSECLDELAHMIGTSGMGIIHPSPAMALKEIAKQIADRDNSVRNSALNTVVQAYYIEGEKIYKLIGQLSDKDQSLLDERIKRAAKSRPIAQPGNLTARVAAPVMVAGPPVSSYSAPVGATSPIKPQAPFVNANILQPQNLNTTTVIQSREDVIVNRHPSYLGEPPRSTTLPEKYRIDFEAIDNMFNDLEPIPPLELMDTNIDQFMRGESITLPKRRMAGRVLPMAKEQGQNITPPMVNQSIDLVVSQISDANIRKSMEACAKLEKMLMDPETSSIMSGRVDTMLSMIALQMRRQQPTLISSNHEKLVELNKFFRTAVALLTVLFKGDFLPKRASKDSLKDIIYHLLVLIIDEHLDLLSDASTIIKLINVMVVRIIEKADPNSISCALIRLLNETLSNTTLCQTRLLELVMKCQWKLLKQYNIWLEKKEYEWDLGGILTEFASFMRAHPFSSFQSRDATPLKTIKTILHALVLQVGCEQLNYQLNIMPDLRDSEAGRYLCKLIAREQGRTTRTVTSNTSNMSNTSSASIFR